ncbi:DNA repair protein rad50 [Coemansia sp. RSA 1365]|nr:DNA repair protein rad50 [Coemansia sp. RSA 1365]
MSVLRKLLIQGIRSFDPQNQDIIEFYAPLTIIVGQNGCGKTTIIESLKYITTGELPPNSKGGAFIHDPKLVGENEVKAQVKLRFYNISHRSMTCVRSMLLSQKKVTVTQKTLEGVLSFDATATEEKVSISSRCADLDAMLPEQLGVSKAVLENVIFCHQEESNWPLSEPSILKKRFDEIFAATRYTKALESIKTIRKTQAVDIRVARGELKHLEEKKAKSERVRSEYEKATVSIHQYRERIDDIQRQEASVTAQIEALAGQLQEFMSLQTTIDGLQMNLDQKVASYSELESNTTIIAVSADELGRRHVEVARQIESQESDIQNKREERDRLQGQIQQLQKQVNESLSEIGRLRAAQESLEKKIASRATAISDQCTAFNISVDPNGDAERQTAECMTAIESLLGAAESERESSRQKAKETEHELQAAIDATQSEIYSFTNAASVSERQTAANNNEIRNLSRKRDSMLTEASQREELEAEVAKETKLLEQARTQDSEDSYRDTCKQRRVELTDIGDEIARINAEISHNNRQADTRAKLVLRRKELESNDEQSKLLSSTPGLSDYVSGTQSFASESERTAVISRSIESKKKEISDCTARSKEVQGILSSTKMRLDMARQSRDEQLKDIGHKRQRIDSVGGIEKFDNNHESARKELVELMEEAGQYKNVSSMYKAFIKKVETSHSCPICQRGWSCKEDEAKVVEKLRVDFTKAPANLLEIEREIRDCQRRVDELNSLEPSVRDVRHWDTQVSGDLDTQIKTLTEQEAQAMMDSDETDGQSAVLLMELDDMIEHLRKSEELVRVEDARKELQRQIEALEHELQATGSTKTIDELQAEIERHQQRDATVRRELDRLSHDHELKQKEVSFRQDSIRTLQNRLSELARRTSERNAIQERIVILESNNVKNESECQEAKAKADSLSPQMQENHQRLASFRSDAREKEQRIDQRIRDIMQGRDRLALMSDEIEQTRASMRCDPGNSKYPDRLTMVTAQRDELLEQVDTQNSTLSNIVSVLQESDRIAGKLSATLREISDNMRLRANATEQEKIKADLNLAKESQARLEAQLSQIYDGSADASDSADETSAETKTTDDELLHIPRKRRRGDNSASGSHATKRHGGARLQKRRNILNAKLSQLTSERAGLQGEVKQLEDQARRLNHELSTDYKDVDTLYVRQLVQCKTEELANTDLETYGKALDAAIMQYHSLKMQDINKIIRELWINTYQGTDIDTIEIRSEVEGARNSRSHNYRVVMIKAGHAIDMRGRCSAGQKVLACLIIRLALAETFSVNCGILALDEPTTNLDQENIDSLARSLARIIKSRQEQRNFQLIVITHDEIFMQLLGKSEYADYYWRVYKNENQCSVFARRPIANS